MASIQHLAHILRPGDQETTVRWVNNVIVSSYNGYTGDLDLDTELRQLGLCLATDLEDFLV